MFERAIQRKIAASRRSFLLLGPRQVGKSTLLASLEPELTLNLADPATFRSYVTRPERLTEELRAAGRNIRTVFLDEVQRVPALLDVVQVLLDEKRDRFRFLLSGSSARKLRRGQANLLPGRIHLHHLHPLLASEIGESFHLDSALAHGTLPGIVTEADASTRAADLRAYVDVYLREEVQAEALVRDLGGYARLLDLAAASSGRVLNLNALCRDAGVSYETARRYLQVLEDTLIAFRISAWSGSDRASLVAHPRIYLFDLGVRNALLHRPLDRPLVDERGLLFEHFVAYELYRRIGTLWPDLEVFYWRTRHGAEVDFIARIGREVWAIEAKVSRAVDRAEMGTLRSIGDHVRGVKRRIVVCTAPRKRVVDGIEILPFEDFLQDLPS
ncbi:MAG: ATP-binding protein [Planctomycetes bacterium]|nr:ATP-binding protein [Planctomycetota bacterium]